MTQADYGTHAWYDSFIDTRVLALHKRAESAMNHSQGKSKSYSVAWYVIHGSCKPYATLNDIKRDITEYWLRVSHHVVSDSTKREFEKILASLVPTFNNDAYIFPTEIIHMIEQEMQDMKRFTFKPNYIYTGRMPNYQIYRATMRIDNETGKRRLGDASKVIYTVDNHITAEKVIDALTDESYKVFTAIRTYNGKDYHVQSKRSVR